MKISVIIPCHNAGPYIEQALESVRTQSLQPFEVIVVNDRSTDDSSQRIQSFPLNIKVIDSNHGNAALARNTAVAASSGDWLAFLDSDGMALTFVS